MSVWTLDGKLSHAFYGPGRYGGGGTLDPADKTRFYYDGMEFKLDWASRHERAGGGLSIAPGEDDISSQFRAGPPRDADLRRGPAVHDQLLQQQSDRRRAASRRSG